MGHEVGSDEFSRLVVKGQAAMPSGTGEIDHGETADPGPFFRGQLVEAMTGGFQCLRIGTGSELQLALDARETLAEKGVDARVVSMPSWELFRSQPQEYRDEVLPPEVRARVSVEAGSDSGWHEWVGLDGEVIGMRTFGASAPYAENLKHFGFTVENVVAKALAVAGKNRLD